VFAATFCLSAGRNHDDAHHIRHRQEQELVTGEMHDGPNPQRSVEEAALQGDRGAIAALWQCHRRWVAAVLLAYKPRADDLEDLLQDVAMTMLTKINTVREAGNIRAWLRTVAINTARASGRSERSRPAQRLDHAAIDALPCANHATTAAPRFELNDEAQRVMLLAESLPEGYREPLLLKAVHGMRTRQISEILDLPEATVDTRVSRARRMLREQVMEQNTEVRDQKSNAPHAGSDEGRPGPATTANDIRARLAGPQPLTLT
jgi:RNA polymerase sigma-70 factor (ECF subfamily)